MLRTRVGVVEAALWDFGAFEAASTVGWPSAFSVVTHSHSLTVDTSMVFYLLSYERERVYKATYWHYERLVLFPVLAALYLQIRKAYPKPRPRTGTPRRLAQLERV